MSTKAPCSVRTQRAAVSRTATPNRALLQTQKHVKEHNSAPVRVVLCARRETCLKSLLNLPLLALVPTNTYQNDVKKPVLESILEKTVGHVLSESNLLREKLDALSLKVTAPNLLELSASLMLIRENERKNHCCWLSDFIVLTIINPQSNQKLFRHQISFLYFLLLGICVY